VVPTEEETMRLVVSEEETAKFGSIQGIEIRLNESN
jgi:hypothetical protein